MDQNRARRIRRSLAALTAFSALFAGVASADTVYNTVDRSVDSDIEVMNLTAGGDHGATTLEIQVDDRPDHPNCNIQGANFIVLAITNSNPAAASVDFVDGDDRFDTCADTLSVDVTPLAAGTTSVSFSIDTEKTPSDPHLAFSLVEASFQVNVTPAPDGGGGGGTECDADPAAPAWANAMLRAGGYKNKMATNLISEVAGAMGPGATFGGELKNDHPAYEAAVLSYLKLHGAPNAVMAGRPGWVCQATTPATPAV
jgi:hypothetical protein